MFSRSTPALRRGQASCARRMPFVVRHSSATPGTVRSMAHSSGISRRTRGSPPVMRILFTPNRAAGGALLGHLAGGAALYGASVPGDRGVGDALRLRGRQRHHPGPGGEPGGLAHRVGYWLPVAGFLHVPGEGISGAYVTGRGGKSAAEPELDTVYTSYHYGYFPPCCGRWRCAALRAMPLKTENTRSACDPFRHPSTTWGGKVQYTVGIIGMLRSTHSDEFRAAVQRVCATATMISAALGYRKQEDSL